MTTKAEIFKMSALELVEEAAEEINVFERPSRRTSIALVEMVKSQAVKIAELEKSGNEMAIIIADLRAHLKIRGKQWIN
jgi:hypothetical protein